MVSMDPVFSLVAEFVTLQTETAALVVAIGG